MFLLIILFSKGFFDFSGAMDGYLREAYGSELMNQIVAARKSIFSYDLIRAIIYCLLIFAVLYYFHKGKLTKNISLIVLIVLMLSSSTDWQVRHAWHAS